MIFLLQQADIYNPPYPPYKAAKIRVTKELKAHIMQRDGYLINRMKQ